jgi:O-antigen ligase
LTSAIVRRLLLGAFVVGLGFSITLSETALALLTLLWLWRLRDPEVRRAQVWPLWVPVLAFSVVSVISALASGHAVQGLLASKGLLLASTLFVTADALPGSQAADRFLSAVAVVSAGAALVGLVQVGLCPGPEPVDWWPRFIYHRCERAHGLFSIYMTLAGVLTLVVLAMLPRVVPGRGFRPASSLLWLVALAGLIATYTRGAWLGVAAGMAAALPVFRRRGWIVVGVLALIVVGLLVMPYEVRIRARTLVELRHRILTMVDPREAGVQERRYMWESGTSMWRERPLLGWGPGGVKREYERYARPEAFKKRTGHVHNTPLQILAERGLLGLAAWLSIWIVFYVRALALLGRLPPSQSRERALVVGSLAAVTGFLVAGLSEYNFGDAEVVMVAWAVMALPFAVARGMESRAPAFVPGKTGDVSPSPAKGEHVIAREATDLAGSAP